MIWYVVAFLGFVGAPTFARYDPDAWLVRARVRIAISALPRTGSHS